MSNIAKLTDHHTHAGHGSGSVHLTHAPRRPRRDPTPVNTPPNAKSAKTLVRPSTARAPSLPFSPSDSAIHHAEMCVCDQILLETSFFFISSFPLPVSLPLPGYEGGAPPDR